MFEKKSMIVRTTGSSAAWLAHQFWELRVVGSNPSCPTTLKSSVLTGDFFVLCAGTRLAGTLKILNYFAFAGTKE